MTDSALSRWFAAAAAVAGLLCSGAARAQEVKLTVGNWCPFMCVGGDETARGYLVDLTAAVFEHEHLKVSFVAVPYARALHLVRENRIQGLVGTTRPEAPDLVYPELEQGLSGSTFFVRADNPWRYRGPDSLAELRKVGLVQSYDYAELNQAIARDPRRVEAIPGDDSAVRNLQKLFAGRIDALIDDPTVAQFALHRMGKQGAAVAAGSLRDSQPIFIAFSPTLPAAAHYAELISRGTQRLRESGELTRLLARYGLRDWRAPDGP
jgi:polar amino acid transport system substrate-binding protein